MDRLSTNSSVKRLLAGFLLLILCLYDSSTTLFYHSHIVDGERVTHSHFFTKVHTESQSGGHTVEVINLIAALSNFVVEVQDFNTHIAECYAQIESIALVRPTACASRLLKPYSSLRAPPTAIA